MVALTFGSLAAIVGTGDSSPGLFTYRCSCPSESGDKNCLELHGDDKILAANLRDCELMSLYILGVRRVMGSRDGLERKAGIISFLEGVEVLARRSSPEIVSYHRFSCRWMIYKMNDAGLSHI